MRAWIRQYHTHGFDRPRRLLLDGAETLSRIQTPKENLRDLSGLEIHHLHREAEADSVGLGKEELATVLLTLGVKYNYGLPAGTVATPPQIASFWRSLQLQDLALAHACALGRDEDLGSIIAEAVSQYGKEIVFNEAVLQ